MTPPPSAGPAPLPRATGRARVPAGGPGPPARPKRDAAQALLDPAEVWAKMKHAWDHLDPNGSPTHFPTIAQYWSWMPGEVSLVTGWPGSGKSWIMLFLMLTKSRYDGWQWALLCPENMPARKLVNILVQMLVGQTCNPKYQRMSFAQYEEAAGWVLKHFHIINPREAENLAEVAGVIRHCKETYGINGYLIDPWNSLGDNLKDYGGREDEMLKHLLGYLCDFTEDDELCGIVCAHPSGDARPKAGAELIVPDQYKVSGGRMWGNKVDNVIVINRPYYESDPTDTAVDFYVKKVKEQPETGFPTPPGGVRLHYSRGSYRYTDPVLGTMANPASPLDEQPRQLYEAYGCNDLARIVAEQIPRKDGRAMTPGGLAPLTAASEFDAVPADRLPSGARPVRLPHANE
jgi:twinkle protein